MGRLYDAAKQIRQPRFRLHVEAAFLQHAQTFIELEARAAQIAALEIPLARVQGRLSLTRQELHTVRQPRRQRCDAPTRRIQRQCIEIRLCWAGNRNRMVGGSLVSSGVLATHQAEACYAGKHE